VAVTFRLVPDPLLLLLRNGGHGGEEGAVGEVPPSAGAEAGRLPPIKELRDFEFNDMFLLRKVFLLNDGLSAIFLSQRKTTTTKPKRAQTNFGCVIRTVTIMVMIFT
jgi:hypothetical protein